MLPITKMIYRQSILTTTQYEDQSPGDKWHNIFIHPVFTCAPTSYVTGCVDQHLDGSSVWPSNHLPLKARPVRHHKTPLSSEVTQWHAQSTRVAFDAPPRKAQEPLTINRRWPRTISFSYQHLQQSPSRLGAVLSKSNKKSTGYTTLKLCNALWDHSISLLICNQAREKSGRRSSSSKDAQEC
jgi:hypothetical protein